jgi:hypothetical protein
MLPMTALSRAAKQISFLHASRAEILTPIKP